MNQSSKEVIELLKDARRIRRDRSQPRRVRWAAFKVSVAFGLRVLFGWHDEPKPWVKKLSGDFRHGNYCGVGVGLSEGETAPPTDDLDAACHEHDGEYL